MGEDGDIDNGEKDGTCLCCSPLFPGELAAPLTDLFEYGPCPEGLSFNSSEEGENMVGDKIPESTEKLDGELGTWQSGDLENFVSVKFVLLSLSSDPWKLLKDDVSGVWSEKSRFAGETISSGSKSRSKSNGDDGGDESRGDGGAKYDVSNDWEAVKQLGTECIIWNRKKSWKLFSIVHSLIFVMLRSTLHIVTKWDIPLEDDTSAN